MGKRKGKDGGKIEMGKRKRKDGDHCNFIEPSRAKNKDEDNGAELAATVQASTGSSDMRWEDLEMLKSIKQALDDFNSGNDSGSDLTKLVSDCIATFKDNLQYRDDTKFLKIWFLYMGFIEDFVNLFLEMLDKKICIDQALLYVWYAAFLESKGKLYDAQMVYQMGISRNAKPEDWVEKAHGLFLNRMSAIVSSTDKVDNGQSIRFDKNINPWSNSTMNALLKKITPQLMKFDGYHSTTKAYSGKVTLSSLKNSSRNKTIKIGHTRYQIMGYVGQGGFAQVYKAYVNGSPDDVVALKIQKPAFPWEFYMYRELDQ